MALSAKSLLLYGYEVTDANKYIDFKTSALQTPMTAPFATLNLGFYSLTSLLTEVVRALNVADPAGTYTATANRTISGGLENRVTITQTAGSGYFDLIWFTGLRSGASAASLLGFLPTDLTGFLTYTGTLTTGTALVPAQIGYNWLDPDFNHKVFGAVNVATIGEKEAVVFQIQRFLQIQFKYETLTRCKTEWKPFLDWAIQQRRFEITPEYPIPGVFYEVTLEKSDEDGKGLAYRVREMLPSFPNLFDVGTLVMREVVLPSAFIL